MAKVKENLNTKEEKQVCDKENSKDNTIDKSIKKDKKSNNSKLDKTKKPKKQREYTTKSRATIQTISCLSYLLFFLPFIFCKKEPFALFHANQSLVLWIFATIFYLSFAFIPVINTIALSIIVIFHIMAIFYGMYTSAYGKAKTMPLIGKITIIKYK